MPPFRLTVLGPPALHGPDGNRVRFRTRKHLALLIYLAVESDSAHRRDKLATMLWGRAPIDEARHSLATGLTMLRARLGHDVFATTRDTVRLIPDGISTDLDDLADRDDADGPIPGPFLEEFEIGDAPEFQQWKEGEFARLMPSLHRVLTQGIDHARRHGDTRRMEAVAERLLSIDPLSEEAVRARIETRAMSGDRVGALRLFDAWRVKLAEELGAVPSAAMERIAARLRRGHWARRSPVIVAPNRPSSADERPFIGRGEEFASCYTVWEKARAGEPHHVLVRGESGVGKTTLIERVAAAVALEGAAVARVKCYELERELPFGVIGGLVSHLLDLPGAGTTPPEQLAELGRLVQKVRERYPSLPAPIPSAGESARILFTEAVMALIAAIAGDHPVVLVVDDIHLSDATSLAVLHLLLRRIRDLPLMVMLSSSSAIEAESAEAHQFVERAGTIAMTQLGLRPFTESEAGELLDALVVDGARPGATIRRALLAGARGNPMVLELLLLDWRRRGDDCLAISLGAMTSTAATPREEAFRRVVGYTLAALDPEARSAAELGAILGTRLNDLSLYSLVDLPVARTMRAMTTLTGHRILRDAGATLEFANDFVRGQCYLAIASPLRRMLHGAVADRLLADGGELEPIPGLEIAWHLVRAERLREAVPYLLAGGREAIRRAAPHEADLALSTGLPALSGDSRRAAILLLAEAQQELGRWADSLGLLDGADEAFSESELACRDVYRIIALRWLGALSLPELVASTDHLLKIARHDSDLEVRVKACAACVRLLMLTRNSEQIIALDDCLLTIDRNSLDAFEQIHLSLARGWLLATKRDMTGALQEVSRAVELADATGIASSIKVRLLIGRGALLAVLGRYQDGISPLQAADKLAARLDNSTLRAECASQLALLEGRLGNHKEQIDNARRALRLFSPTEWGPWVIGATYELALGLVAEGEYGEARAAIAPLLRVHDSEIPQWVQQAGLLFSADVLALTGSMRRALATARRATSDLNEGLQNLAYAGQFARWVSLLAVNDGKLEGARDRLNSAFPDIRILDKKDQAELLVAIAILDEKLGVDATSSWRAARQHVEQLPIGAATVLEQLALRAGVPRQRFATDSSIA